MKIVINACFGGFKVSEDFLKEYNIPYEKGRYGSYWATTEIDFRTDPRLIAYIEKYGSKKASGPYAHLIVEEIPKGVYFMIDEYDGNETIMYRDDMPWILST